MLTTGNVRHAMAARVIELGGVDMKNVDYHRGEQLKKVMVENSGWAGHVYLQYLVRPDVLAHVRTLLEVTTKKLWDTGRFNHEHRYWVRALATMDVGGNIAKHLGLIRADVSGRIMPWLMEQCEDTNAAVRPRPEAIEALAEYINDHRQYTLIMPRPWRQHDSPHPIQLPQRELRVRYEVEGRRYLVVKGPFQEWMTRRQQNYRESVKWLLAKGVLLSKNRFLKVGAGTSNPGPQVECLIVNGAHEALWGVEPVVEDGKVVKLRAPE